MTRPFTLHRPSHQTSALLAGSGAALALLSSTHLVDDLYQGAVPALLPFLALSRHYSYTGLTGITLAATFLSSAVQPVFGVLTDRHRLGWLVPAGLLVAGIGVGLAAPLVGFLADRFGLRLALAALVVLPAVSLALAAGLREPRPGLRAAG
jgi:MFS family permease